jgi:putative transposase
MALSRSFINIWVHLVWTVKKREPLLHKSFRTQLCKHIHQHARQQEIHLDTINGVEDHLHCLVSMKSTQSISQIVKTIKGESSKWLNDVKLVEGVFEWQEGYGAFSVSPTHLKKVRNYIKNQEQHHLNRNFEEEMFEIEKMMQSE